MARTTAAATPLARLRCWVDSDAYRQPAGGDIDWLRVVPFVLIHLGCLGALYTGVSAAAALVAILMYLGRMFAITAFYHRYFSHRAFRTSRPVQFLFALAGATAAQRGPLWWASHHRHHHAASDGPDDAHSPVQRGFLWSHIIWFLTRENFARRSEYVRDLERYAELRFLDRFDVLAPLGLAAALYALGAWLEQRAPGLGTNGLQMLVWGFFVSTVALYHATFLVNSLCHRFGSRRYATSDDSRNNGWIALLTLGEGWHNNHHHYPGAARQGFYWWELDVTWLGLRLMALTGLISDLKTVPERILAARRTVEQG